MQTTRQFEAIDTYPVRRWLLALDRRDELSVEEGRPESIVETYLDTADGRLFHAGMMLGIREIGGRREVFLAPRGGAEVESLPDEIVVVDPADDVASVIGGDHPLGGHVRSLVGRRPLVERVELRGEHTYVTVYAAGEQRATIRLERLTIGWPSELESSEPLPSPIPIARVWVWWEDDDAVAVDGLLSAMVDDCALRAVDDPPYLSALIAMGRLPGEQRSSPGSTVITADASTSEVAYAFLRRQLQVLIAHEPGTRLGVDIEQLHDMRVATRRMRATIRLFADHLPSWAGRARDELRLLGAALGRVRDLDVQIEGLAGWRQSFDEPDQRGLDAIVDLLVQRRVVARKQMLAFLDSRRFERSIDQLARNLRRGPPLRLRRASPILLVAPQLIERRYERVTRLGGTIRRRTRAHRYHRLRIRAKSLRYALEVHVEVYGKPARRLVRSLAVLQDLLGEHQDADVWSERLHRLADEDGRRLPPVALFVAGKLAEQCERRARRLRRGFGRAYAPLTGQRWQQMQRAMSDRAAALETPPVIDDGDVDGGQV